MYQRVQRVECSSPRPVLLLGPLVEASKDLLVTESPARFCRCLPGEIRGTSVRRDQNKDFYSTPLICWPAVVVVLICAAPVLQR